VILASEVRGDVGQLDAGVRGPRDTKPGEGADLAACLDSGPAWLWCEHRQLRRLQSGQASTPRLRVVDVGVAARVTNGIVEGVAKSTGSMAWVCPDTSPASSVCAEETRLHRGADAMDMGDWIIHLLGPCVRALLGSLLVCVIVRCTCCSCRL
jgi:hypothetical protein